MTNVICGVTKRAVSALDGRAIDVYTINAEAAAGIRMGWSQSRRKLAQDGVSFADAARFDFVSALELEGVNEFEEVRLVKLGKVGRVLHVIVYTQRQEKIRIISFRKATAAERRFYIAVKGY